jgi:hypothetical protein
VRAPGAGAGGPTLVQAELRAAFDGRRAIGEGSGFALLEFSLALVSCEVARRDGAMANRDRGCGGAGLFGGLARQRRFVERLIEVLDQILHILEPDRQS